MQSRNPKGYFWSPPAHSFKPEYGPDFVLKSWIPNLKKAKYWILKNLDWYMLAKSDML